VPLGRNFRGESSNHLANSNSITWLLFRNI